MEHKLGRVFQKPSDYKVCRECRALNWYENEECRCCGAKQYSVTEEEAEKIGVEDWDKYDTGNFDKSEEAVREWCIIEYEYWIKEEGYTEEEADNVLVGV